MKQLRLGMKLLRRRRYESAIWHLRNTLALQPGNLRASRGLSQAYLRLGGPTKAIGWANHALSLKRNDVNNWLQLGDVQRAQGDTAGARASYGEAAKLSPKNKTVRKRIAGLR